MKLGLDPRPGLLEMTIVGFLASTGCSATGASFGCEADIDAGSTAFL